VQIEAADRPALIGFQEADAVRHLNLGGATRT